jgi:hypothetical protein
MTKTENIVSVVHVLFISNKHNPTRITQYFFFIRNHSRRFTASSDIFHRPLATIKEPLLECISPANLSTYMPLFVSSFFWAKIG